MSTTLPETDPAENPIVEFDFEGELTAPESAVITVTPVNGADPDAASMLIGSAQFAGSSVYQRVQPNVAGLNYKLRCKATQGDDVRVRVGILPARTA